MKEDPAPCLKPEDQTMSTLTVMVTSTGEPIRDGRDAIRKAGHNSKGGLLQPTVHVRRNKEDHPILTVNTLHDRGERQEQITISDHGVAAAVEDQEVQHRAEVEAAVVAEEAEVAAAGVKAMSSGRNCCHHSGF